MGPEALHINSMLVVRLNFPVLWLAIEICLRGLLLPLVEPKWTCSAARLRRLAEAGHHRRIIGGRRPPIDGLFRWYVGNRLGGHRPMVPIWC